MKKIIMLLISNIFILNSVMVLTACQPPALGEIWVITDGGDLFDKAFNQQVVEGSQDFVDKFNKNRNLIGEFPNFDYWKNHNMRLKYIISKNGDLSTLQNNYNIAAYAGAKTIICVGFNHFAALTPKIQEMYKNLGIRIILVDSKVNNPINVAGLTYSSEQSGFLAGLAGSIWLAANHEKYDRDGLKMSTFGGLPANTVISYMMGYYWGIDYFNQYKITDKDILIMINAIRAKNENSKMTEQALETKNIIFDKLDNSFTGGFESGTNDARVKTSHLINDFKNDIVLPVAGAQTTDLISAIVNSPNNNSAKIIGVDVDQSQQYDYAKNLFVTSALKGIHSSVEWMLWNSLNLKKDIETGKISFQPDAEKYFNGQEKYLPLAGKEYNGIADSPEISAIYQLLIDNENKYWSLANQVSIIFDKLSKDLENVSNSDKWENAWKIYVDKDNLEYHPDFK